MVTKPSLALVLTAITRDSLMLSTVFFKGELDTFRDQSRSYACRIIFSPWKWFVTYFFSSSSNRMKFYSPLGVVETNHLNMTEMTKVSSDVTLQQQTSLEIAALASGWVSDRCTMKTAAGHRAFNCLFPQADPRGLDMREKLCIASSWVSREQH